MTVVGYQTKTVYAGLGASFGIQFEDVAGAKPVCVSNLIIGVTHKAAAQFDNSDQIWRYDAVGDKWVKYAYHRVSGSVRKWQRWDPKEESWYEIDNAKDVCVSGDVILYVNNNSDDAVITFSGAVKEFTAKPEYTIYSDGCAQFIAYPWPVAIKVSDVANYIIEGSLKAAAQFDNSDQIWRYDAVGDKWVKYAYHRVSGSVRKWQKYNPKSESWDEIDDAVDIIAAGEGFLFVNNDSEDKTFKFTYGD